jgi:anti-sigma regulatory factor (Ser/Thr protein kinase)
MRRRMEERVHRPYDNRRARKLQRLPSRSSFLSEKAAERAALGSVAEAGIIHRSLGNDKDVATFTRQYPSHPASIRAARNDLGTFLRQSGCPTGDRFDICLATAEAVANAVEHGHVPGGVVTVGCRCGDEIAIEVTDEGGGMRSKSWQQVLVKASVGGLGLVLMRALMDDVQLDIDDDCGATVVMRKHCNWNRFRTQGLPSSRQSTRPQSA